MKWSLKEEEILEKLWLRIDINRFMIAEILINRKPGAIAKHASEMGLKKKYTSKINIEKLGEVELYEI